MSVKTYVVDLRIEQKRRNTSQISDFLAQQLRATLERGEQAILLLNKRGFASSLLCTACGTAVFCQACDISMTFHKTSGGPVLMCHYCGIRTTVPRNCPSCTLPSLKTLGTGTQQVEEHLHTLLPTARIQRVDVDTMSKKSAYTELYENVHNHEVDILIGTQILAKGFDFPKVTLVGILNADMSLHVPDFRSGERMFQLITQVMGRASRQGQDGVIILQTFHPELPTLQFALRGDYDGFYHYELAERQRFHYPPFSEMVKCTFVHPKEEVAAAEAEKLRAYCKEALPKEIEVLMAPAIIAKQHHKYHYHVLLKGRDLSTHLKTLSIPQGWRIDIDPMHTT